MSYLTTITRMWLTRSFKPWTFTNENDNFLDFGELDKLGLYIHIPFCKSICSFCPYCKEIYEVEKCNKYIESLIKEIHLVGNMHVGKKVVTSLYFGGGTPALAINSLYKIIDAVKEHFIITEGIGVELHPNDVRIDVLQELQKIGVTKISIGIQSFQKKFQSILGREAVDIQYLKSMLNKFYFETISIDLIFALPSQKYEDLKKDIDDAFNAGANHIAIYPFINFSFLNSNIPVMNNNEKKILLDRISNYCLNKGYVRNSIWTFTNNKKAKYSSMTRDNFLGFGCSATTLLRDQFKINTFSVEEYCNRIDNNILATALTIRFSIRQRMIYYLFWTAYSTVISKKNFKEFFGISLEKMYGIEMKLAKKLGFIIEKNDTYQLSLKGCFYYHYYENYYTLAYIDKMWGYLRNNPFPKRMVL